VKGIVLAGGLGTRLRPLTEVTNKHLLPVYDRPMVFHPIRTLVEAGMDEVLVVTGGEHAGDFLKVLKNGHGIADALALAEAFADGGPVCVMLGDNIAEKPITDAARAFLAQGEGARLLLKRVPDPERFGVARFEGERIVEIIEKPADPPSDLVVTGIYFFAASVFEICRTLAPSARGELEITDVNNVFLRRGTLTWSEMEGWWSDAGTFQSLLRAGRLVAERAAR